MGDFPGRLLAVVLLLGLAGPWGAEAARIRAWGDLGEEDYPVPEGDDFLAISAGADRNLALREDGSIVQWSNWLGEIHPDKWPIPEDKDFVAISPGGTRSLAIRSDGSLVSWGTTPVAPEGNDYVAVALGNENMVLLTEDGTVRQGGHCWSGDCKLPRGKYVAIDAEGHMTVGLMGDGSVVSTPTVHESPETIPSGNDFVAAGAGHVLALREDGSLVAWGGKNEDGELDVPEGNEFVAIAAGAAYSVALRDDGSLSAWGRDLWGRLDVPPGNRFIAISAYGPHGLALEVPEPSALVGLLSMGVVGGLVAWWRTRRRACAERVL